MATHRQWLTQASDRVGAGFIRWNIVQLRWHLRVVWRMTYPSRAPIEPRPQVSGAPTSCVPSPPEVLVAPTHRDIRPPGEDNGRVAANTDSEDPTVAECLPIFLCALRIIRQLIDRIPWENYSLRNIPVESDELHKFLKVVQEVSQCDNSTISAAIDTRFVQSI